MPHDPTDERFCIDANGVLTERVSFGDMNLVIHYDDVPESDVTTIDGVRVTTPVRTMIDIAPDVDFTDFVRMVGDCLSRGLFSVEEAMARTAEADMAERPGAKLLLRALPPR